MFILSGQLQRGVYAALCVVIGYFTALEQWGDVAVIGLLATIISLTTGDNR